MNDDDRRWGIVVRRERTDAGFLYGVRTTGIYCRPGCASRTPRRENVRFYANASDAERDGLRACRRCGGGARPLAAH